MMLLSLSSSRRLNSVNFFDCMSSLQIWEEDKSSHVSAVVVVVDVADGVVEREDGMCARSFFPLPVLL